MFNKKQLDLIEANLLLFTVDAYSKNHQTLKDIVNPKTWG